MPSRNILLHGSDAPLDERIALRAGPLSMEFEPSSAMLRRVRLGDREVLRGIYGAVRDPLWRAVGPLIRDLAIDRDGDRFRVAFIAECRRGPIDFAWRGTIVGRPDGSVTYTFDGLARSRFLRARIGLCVLHPIRECAGRPCRVETLDGRVEPGTFPASIAPHQPFTDLRAISHEVAPGFRAEVRFEGDAFEMEDQRNWTDASFKTYSTPLRRPFPVEVSEGTPVRQGVALTLAGPIPPGTPSRRRPPDLATVTHGGSAVARPRIGLGLAIHGPARGPRQASLLKALRPDHLRVDLDLDDPGFPDVLGRASAEAIGLAVSLEVALLLGDDPGGGLRRLAEQVVRLRPPVISWLVFPGPKGTTSGPSLDLAREWLAGHAPQALFGVGTNQYFTELNRDPPPVRGADLVCYSLNPQVHAFDDLSMVETLDGQAATVREARRVFGRLPVAVTPITLRPRFNPHCVGGTRPPGPDGPQSPADPRQRSLFAAAWTLASIRRMAEAGAASLTYFETVGPRGVIESDAGSSPAPDELPRCHGSVFPAYHVFADLACSSDGALDVGRCSHPLEVESVAFRRGDRQILLVANLTPQPRRVAFAVEGGGGGGASSWRVRPLDEANAERAMADPDAFRSDAGVPLDTPEVELGPYCVARVERVEGGPRR